MICPICKTALEPNDELYLVWYEPSCKWELHHDKEVQTDMDTVMDTYTIRISKEWCVQADHPAIEVSIKRGVDKR